MASLRSVSLDALDAHDQVIDARSPSEYAHDHIPGAVNLPVLSDAERARIGVLYKQVGPFEARRAGAALIARNVAAHLEGPLARKPGGYQPLVYCWRGGQRSRSMAIILAEIGWRTSVLTGGYKTYRADVVARLYGPEPGEGRAVAPGPDDPGAPPFIVLDGDTGVGKTRVLHALRDQGAAMLDLEGLARHRGSLFGADPQADQPSQKAFESALVDQLSSLSGAACVFVEAESNRIGRLGVPPRLWRALSAGRRLELRAPLEARVRAIVRDYADFAAHPDRVDAALRHLAPFHPRAQIEAWRAAAQERRLDDLVRSLLADHYDAAYARSRDAGDRSWLGALTLDDESDAAAHAAAADVRKLVAEALYAEHTVGHAAGHD